MTRRLRLHQKVVAHQLRKHGGVPLCDADVAFALFAQLAQTSFKEQERDVGVGRTLFLPRLGECLSAASDISVRAEIRVGPPVPPEDPGTTGLLGYLPSPLAQSLARLTRPP